MSDDKSFDWLREQLSLLTRRVERLEGNQERLRRDVSPPGMLYPTRKEFEALAARLTEHEKARGRGAP